METEMDIEVLDRENSEATEATSKRIDQKGENTNQKFRTRLPVARVKTIMKKDPDCSILSQDAVFLVTKATELFIAFLAKETGKQISTSKRKTITKKDVDNTIESCPVLCFLDGALE